jgi:hypothetical protein
MTEKTNKQTNKQKTNKQTKQHTHISQNKTIVEKHQKNQDDVVMLFYKIINSYKKKD